MGRFHDQLSLRVASARRLSVRLRPTPCLIRSEHGATLIETALSFAIVLSMTIGIMEIGLALYSYHFVSEAARDATRYAMVRGSSCTATGCPATNSSVQSYITGLGYPGIDPSKMSVSTTWPSTNAPGNSVKVTATYQFPLSVPFVTISTINMSSTSEMVISQ